MNPFANDWVFIIFESTIIAWVVTDAADLIYRILTCKCPRCRPKG